jgi:hypothetical protein
MERVGCFFRGNLPILPRIGVTFSAPPFPLSLFLSAVNLIFVAFATMVVGFVVARKWEGIDGLLILGGFALFAVVNHGAPCSTWSSGRCWAWGCRFCSAGGSEAGLAPIDYASGGCRLMGIG